MSDTETSFPVFTFSICIILDVMRAMFTITLVAIPIAMVFSIISDVVVLCWTFWMSGASGIADLKMKKKIMSRFLKRMIFAAGGSFLPAINLFPWASYAIYTTWEDINNK